MIVRPQDQSLGGKKINNIMDSGLLCFILPVWAASESTTSEQSNGPHVSNDSAS